MANEGLYEGVEILPGSAACRHLRAVAPLETRTTHAEAKVEAIERRVNEMRRCHEEALAADEADALCEITKVLRRAEQQVRTTDAQMQAVQKQRIAVEMRLLATEEEVMAMEFGEAENRAKLEQEVALADQRTVEALQMAQEQMDTNFNASHSHVRGLLGNLQMNCEHSWSIEDGGEWAKMLTGVRSHRRDAKLHLVPRPRPLPFGQMNIHPFDGYGTYGKKPPTAKPPSFCAETLHKLHAKRAAATR